MRGEYEILYVQIEKVWTPIACLIDNPISESTALIPTTTRDNQGWESYVAGIQSASINFDAILPDDPTGKADYYALRDLKRSRQTIMWRIKNHINGHIDEGLGIISEIGKSSPADDLISFNGTITVTTAIESTTELEIYAGFPYIIPNLTP